MIAARPSARRAPPTCSTRRSSCAEHAALRRSGEAVTRSRRSSVRIDKYMKGHAAREARAARRHEASSTGRITKDGKPLKTGLRRQGRRRARNPLRAQILDGARAARPERVTPVAQTRRLYEIVGERARRAGGLAWLTPSPRRFPATRKTRSHALPVEAALPRGAARRLLLYGGRSTVVRFSHAAAPRSRGWRARSRSERDGERPRDRRERAAIAAPRTRSPRRAPARERCPASPARAATGAWSCAPRFSHADRSRRRTRLPSRIRAARRRRGGAHRRCCAPRARAATRCVRKSRRIVYFKGVDAISQVLATIGASHAVFRLEDQRALKETKNRIHRLVNTEAANVVRAMSAAALQRESIALPSRRVRLTQSLRPAAGSRRAALSFPTKPSPNSDAAAFPPSKKRRSTAASRP